MNNRRKLCFALGIAASMPRKVLAQAKKPPVLIGWLHGGSSTDHVMRRSDKDHHGHRD